MNAPVVNITERLLTRSVQVAYRYIRTRIVTGVFQPGDVLTEKELSLAIGVSRTPVREALDRLQMERLVDLEKYKQTRVAEISDQDIEEVFLIRLALEPEATGLAASNLTREQSERIERNIAETEAVLAAWTDDSVGRFVELNVEFHLALLEAAGMPRIAEIVVPLIDIPTIPKRTPQTVRGRHYFEQGHRHHREILSALQAGNAPWAAAQMRTHLLSAHQGQNVG